jgi:hypothetical protein
VAIEESKRLVIDASVAHAAGDKEGASINCRDFLMAVRDSCHRLVMTPEIYDEWQRRNDEKGRKPSRFLLTWLAEMTAREKINVYADIPTYEELWNKIEETIDINQGVQAALKDFLLIKAALGTDKIIVSLDEKARKPFKIAAIQVNELKDIVWINPDKIEEEKPIEWLENGAEAESDRLLGTLCDREHL